MDQARRESGFGQESRVERWINRYSSVGIHIFLSILAVFVFLGAVTATVMILAHDFPKLLQSADEYRALQIFIQDILLVAIAGELALLLLYHRTGAAIEVIVFVIARKLVSPEISSLELLFGSVALSLLIFVRVYLMRGRS